MKDEDALADFLAHKKRLTDIFFPNSKSAIIHQWVIFNIQYYDSDSDTSAYDEFWKFLLRLQKIVRKSCSEGLDGCLLSKKSKLNIRTSNYRLEDYVRHSDVSRHSHRSLARSELDCFHLIYDMYLDFLLKRKFARIVKLRIDQSVLPIANFRTELLSTLSKHQVVIVAGDTGCGKSTQVPQYLYYGESNLNDTPGPNSYQNIAVTQPRRIACISLAARVSTEMLNERGSKVGYQVRFERSRTKATRILFLTEGLLLRQMQRDPFLNDYDVIVLDEVHERHWQTDCLLGLVKCLIVVRPKLRVVLMSATINVNTFAKFFNDCPIIQVPGRLYPIDLHYIPLSPVEIANTTDRIDPAPYIRLLRRIDVTYPATERGDLLIFLSGMADIQAIMEPAKAYAEETKRWIILPLHSALSASDQEKVFHVAPDCVRKCILSTNIAETSLTIDGIRFVADSGKVKELSWDSKARMRCLKEFSISKASANQRKGRAGRTGPGVCYRFYTQEDYDNFEAFSTPEIRRVPLETLVLQMLVMGLPDIKKFPFIDPPEMKCIDEALDILKSHGAIIPQNNVLTVTPLGQLLSDIPVEFSIGRMLIMASLLRLTNPVLSLAAGMAIQCPLLPYTAFSGAEQTRRIDALAEYESDHGDAFTLVNVFDEWIKVVYLRCTNIKRWCRRIGAQQQRLHEMVRLRSQFAQLLKDSGLLDSKSTESDKNLSRTQHFKNLNYARRSERMKSKRRRLLTLQDNLSENSESEKEDHHVESDSSKLRKWLSASSRSSINSSNVPVQDLELVLCYNLSSLAQSANIQQNMTQADLQLLKVVLAGGMYPQLAIGDSANAYRVANRGGTAGAGAEMVFHTKVQKSQTSLSNKNSKQSRDDDFDDEQTEEENIPEVLPSGFAYDHQLLMYLDLMETTKPFLVNTIRVPALPTLLLYCREVDTNADISRIVFDSWLEVRLLDVEAAQRAVATTIWLRSTTQCLMEYELAECLRRRDQTLTGDSGDGCDNGNTTTKTSTKYCSSKKDENKRKIRRLQRILSHSLAAFLAGQPGGAYSIKRLLAADVKQLFRKQDNNDNNICENQSQFKSMPKTCKKINVDDIPLQEPDHESGITFNLFKGGYQVTDYLNIDSLYPEMISVEGRSSVEDIDEPEYYDPSSSYNLAVRLRKQIASGSLNEASSDDNYKCLNENTSLYEPNKNENEEDCFENDDFLDEGKTTCGTCGKFIKIQGTLQTSMLRHRRNCQPYND
ncbi:putative atp-dependent RNA helicase [Schistosoma mansoni]|uniref:putative atp-dependent RNA helicase n=1 Tax=Schistosoma mansoni TaxID=6183 RepID=UPI0001A63EEE|nr:putative atp-dependent RNA helicase [Schistosoma mansoni]|eukprot:XP_018650270.1 putative atp-dependent RNA helicase [Schistosoma mansoni]